MPCALSVVFSACMRHSAKAAGVVFVRSGQAFIFLEADGSLPRAVSCRGLHDSVFQVWTCLRCGGFVLHPAGTPASKGSNSILIVGGSNVAWPAEVQDFQRRKEVALQIVAACNSRLCMGVCVCVQQARIYRNLLSCLVSYISALLLQADKGRKRRTPSTGDPQVRQ